MRAAKPERHAPDDLYRARLSQQLDMRHPLVQLAALIAWQEFETQFGALYHDSQGRPGKPIRLMVGLTYLKHSYDLSDEEVCAR
jgi:IS5 family transposase